MLSDGIFSVVCDSVSVNSTYSQASELAATRNVEISVIIGGDGICRILVKRKNM